MYVCMYVCSNNGDGVLLVEPLAVVLLFFLGSRLYQHPILVTR